jgi:hypothetical protein
LLPCWGSRHYLDAATSSYSPKSSHAAGPPISWRPCCSVMKSDFTKVL